MKKSFRTAVLFLVVIIAASLIVSCSAVSKDALDMEYISSNGSAKYDSYDAAEDYYWAETEAPAVESEEIYYSKTQSGSLQVSSSDRGEATGRESDVTSERKIIKTVSLDLETKQFDEAVEKIRASVVVAGGYIESSYVSGESMQSSGTERYASFTLRIPVSGLDSYVNSFSGELYNVLSRNENSSDITDTYYDVKARLTSLQTQEERLLAMLEGATELQYMLQIEQTLADVRYQIENYYSRIQRYDSQVSLSTISIYLREVIEYKPVEVKPITFAERIAKAFENSWEDFVDNCQDFAVEFVYGIPTLIIWIVVIAVIVVVIRILIKRRRKKKAAEKENDIV